ncbi:acyl-CoA N-acyltransferase [Protomyces lactucae-debilis]|uniref:Acyl-CoA N-acyltransferase n=1 Tax=Protomyces lactucae-debilis TaxID=2754530 RepID=A0A1Y2FR15_PROLT|nr:acyl-CoA N-acyltransferase [Protomyces lactucae-debilis]ORY85646.1 acyl-CoA N-acyltransferase [Protomyces lactucae-debilis]
MSFSIRKAREEDVPQMLQFIKDLAEFEKAPEAVFATHEKLSSTLGFTGTAYAHAVIAETKSESDEAAVVVGMAIYFFNYSTWHAAPGIYLEDLYVDQQYRGKGYGTRLLQHLAKLSLDMGGKRLEWSVLKWNEKAIKVYEAVGAEMMTEWSVMRVDGERLDKLAAAAH